MAHPHKDVTAVEGELPEGTARVDLAPGFLKEGREGFAGLLTFLLGQAGQRAGFPPGLLAQLFGLPLPQKKNGNGEPVDPEGNGGKGQGVKDREPDDPIAGTPSGLEPEQVSLLRLLP